MKIVYYCQCRRPKASIIHDFAVFILKFILLISQILFYTKKKRIHVNVLEGHRVFCAFYLFDLYAITEDFQFFRKQMLKHFATCYMLTARYFPAGYIQRTTPYHAIITGFSDDMGMPFKNTENLLFVITVLLTF